MKSKYLVLCACAVAMVSAGAWVFAQDAAPKGEKGIIVGDVVELGTFAMQGYTPDLLAAHKARIEEGFPAGIVEDETGEVWVCVYRNNAPASHLELANKHVVEYVGKKVTVQGLKYKAKGLNVIRVSVISEY
jgi:hypothetical protein